MKPFYFFGSAIFLILAFLKLNHPNAGIWMGAFAYAAILGIYGQIDRKKLVFPVAGSLGYLALLYFFWDQELEFSITNPQFTDLLSLIGCVVWMVILGFKWRKEGINWT